MKDLLPHNLTAYNKIMKMITRELVCCVQQPTGTGKSYLIDAVSTDRKTLFIAPTLSILAQWERLFGDDRNDITYTTYASLHKYTRTKFDLVAFDEFHRTGADVWGSYAQQILNFTRNHGGWVLGTTATTIHRISGDMVKKLFNGNIASEMSLKEAFSQGILKPPKYIAAQYRMDDLVDDLNGKVLTANLDIKEKDNLFKALENAKRNANDMQGIGEIILSNLPNNPKGVIFARNIAHAEEVIHDVNIWFKDHKTNIFTVHSDVLESVDIIKAYGDADSSEEINILISVDMLNEGIHAPGTNFCIFLRPTKSNIVYYQQMGRVLTTDKDDTVVFDLVNNINALKEIEVILNPRDDHKPRGDKSIPESIAELVEIIAVDCSLLEVIEKLKIKLLPAHLALEWFIENDIDSQTNWFIFMEATPILDRPRIPVDPVAVYGYPKFWEKINSELKKDLTMNEELVLL